MPAKSTAIGLVLILTLAIGTADYNAFASLSGLSATAPMSFTENAGQWEDNILFRASAGAATMWFGRDGAYYQFSRELTDRESPLRRDRQGPSPTEVMLVKAAFVGARGNPEVVGQGKLDYRSNYFLGNDPSRWRTNVANFESIVYRGLYPGIDLRYFGNGEYLEYDFIVSAGADPSVIEVRYEGADGIYVNGSGELVVETGWGTVTERCPYVYQETSTGRVEVVGSYRQISPLSFGFSLDGGYDRSLPLIIDPVLTYSTYIGGTSSEYCRGVQIDSSGAVYLVGYTNSVDFPIVNPAQDKTPSILDWDLFVIKMRPETNVIEFATYLGGSEQDDISRLTVDKDGCAYIAAHTMSDDVPTVNALDNTLGGWSDVFVVKLSPLGNEILFSTYLGGSDDEAKGIPAVDTAGHLYVAVSTYSRDFPTVNPIFPWFGTGLKDVTVSKFSLDGTGLIYSTYLGGGQDDECNVCVVDLQGCVYTAGKTYSEDFRLANAYDSTFCGTVDGFVTKLSADGDALVYSTFFGGCHTDWITGAFVDERGQLSVVGGTASPDLPIVNGFQPYHMGGAFIGADAFAARFSASGTNLLLSTFYGGSDDDYGEAIWTDRYGNMFLTGYTYSLDFPMVDPLDDFMNADTADAFIGKIDALGNELGFSSYLGGHRAEGGWSVVVDDLRRAYFAGYTVSEDFPLADPLQGELLGSRDAYLTVIDFGCCDGRSGNADYDTHDYIDVMDVLYFVNWLYKQGSAPECEEEADVNGDGEVDPQDLVYLIEYIWKLGPPPVACQ
ncbi:MAG: SBBP repeat-containing protein [Candidatus Zixiibacteriota bacterium]